MVDFPAPEEPSSAAVTPGCSHGFNGSTERDAAITTTSAPPATDRTASTAASTFMQISDLLSATTGRALLSHASTKYRSMRRKLKSPSSPQTTKQKSTLAATHCDAPIRPAAFRIKAVFRSSTASIRLNSPAGRSHTQSPTAGNSP
jgi:hypothetical protein